MRFKPLELEGAFLIEPDPYRDERGSFTRAYCSQEFAEQRLHTDYPQHSIARTTHKGTVRGMHFQTSPHQEIKLVRCVSGAVHNVIIDLRPASPTYKRWLSFELSEENGRQVYVPEGFAQGCQSLTDFTSVLYLISKPYVRAAASGVRHDDPAFGISWPLPITLISGADRTWPFLS